MSKKVKDLEVKLQVIKEQEQVAKDQKDLGFLRFLVDQRQKTQDEIYSLRLQRSIDFKTKAIKAVELVKEQNESIS